MTRAMKPNALDNKVFLYVVHVADYRDTMRLSDAILSIEERARASRYLREQDRANHIIAHSLKRLVLGHTLQSHPESLRFTANSFGKPELISQEGMNFNISHTANLVVFACSAHPVGVDVESIERTKYDESVAKLVLSDEERITIGRRENRDHALLSYWTAKEAAVKMRGQGLSMDLKSINPVGDMISTPSGELSHYQFTPTEEHMLSVVSDVVGLSAATLRISFVTISDLAVSIGNKEMSLAPHANPSNTSMGQLQ